ncbi:MAG: response regulator transcription factor [Rhodobacteraceae bacterium]|nr:response regulator transcription factor [Paracoccaceae bacterium]
MTQPISVAFVDDHPVLLSGMTQLFAASEEFRVVGIGRRAEDIVDLARTVRPDVIVLDLSMPGRTLEAVAEVANLNGPTKLLAFTASTDIDAAIATLEAGAVGYVLKGSTIEELSEAIRRVRDGETYITPVFAAQVVASLRRKTGARAVPRVVFSKREEEVLRHLLRGSTNKEIAEALSISDKTVKHYMTVLIQKLNVRNRVEVVLAAQELESSGRLGRSAPLN